MEEFEQVLGKDRFRASIKKVSRRVPEKGRITVSNEKMVESGQVPGKGRFRASIEKLSRRVPKMGRIS